MLRHKYIVIIGIIFFIIIVLSPFESLANDSFTYNSNISLSVLPGEDITKPLQSAVDSIKSGGTITIPKGDYTLSSVRIKNKSNITINAYNTNISGEKTISSRPMIYIPDGSASNNITINGGNWSNNKNDNNKSLVHIYGDSNGITLNQMIIDDSKYYGVSINGATNILIKNCTIKNSVRDGIRVVDGKNISIQDSFIDKNNAFGINIIGSNDNTIKNCTITNSYRIGLRIEKSTANVNDTTVKENGSKKNRTNAGHGMYIVDSSVAVSNCNINKNAWCGLATTGSISNVTVSNSEITGNGTRPDRENVQDDDSHSAGLACYEGAKLYVSNCKSTYNRGCGISPCGKEKKVSVVEVEKCDFSFNNDHGIGARPWANVKVKSCVIGNNKYNGILICQNTIFSQIESCDVFANGRYGLSITEESSAKNISNCNIYSNKYHGINIDTSSKAIVKQCKLYSNGDSGIHTDKKSTSSVYDTKLYNNRLGISYSSGGRGVFHRGSIYGNTTGIHTLNNSNIAVKDASIYNNKNYGLLMESGSKASIKKSKILKNTVNGIVTTDKNTLLKIYNSRINNNTQCGFKIKKESSVIVKTCSVNSNGKTGISVNGKKSNIKLLGVTISKNRGSGLLLDKKAQLNGMKKCKITSNTKYGIGILRKSKVYGEYSKNKINSNKKKQIYIKKAEIPTVLSVL